MLNIYIQNIHLSKCYISKRYTHIHNHFTALTRANLTKELHNKGLCHIPRQVSNIPEKGGKGMTMSDLIHLYKSII